jgi:hypothetical protein
MEFSLTINQKQIHENFPVLDIKDAAIIDFLTRFSHAKKIKKRIIGTDVYYWFDYGKIASENPLLKLDRESIRKRVRNICKLGILNAHPDNQGGEVYFAFGDNYEKTHRADLPEVEAQTSGKQSRTHRANNPELLAKHRANNPDNHNNHLSVNQDQGERTPPAPNPSNLQSQKKEMGLVAPAENTETVKAENPPSPNSAATPSPVECHWCKGSGKVFSVLHGRETCDVCDGTGSEPPAQFEVTAIASPTNLPGVTLVEAAPRPIRYDEYPNPRNANELKDRLREYFTHHPEDWRLLIENAKVNWMPEKLEETTLAYCLHQEKEGNMKRTYNTYKAGLTTWFMRQKSWDAQNNAPKEGGATRQNGQPHSALPRSLQKQVGK